MRNRTWTIRRLQGCTELVTLLRTPSGHVAGERLYVLPLAHQMLPQLADIEPELREPLQ